MSGSVLIVDDDPIFLSLATRVLARAGLEVVATADDAAGAMPAARATKPAAILVDVGLPDGAGLDLAYELAALPWRPRVVLTSTDNDAAYAIEPPDGHAKLPFIPKDELANGRLPGLLASR
jgi:DNA-binding NarL/FixJ family response regulator